jgi:hypothetical protein
MLGAFRKCFLSLINICYLLFNPGQRTVLVNKDNAVVIQMGPVRAAEEERRSNPSFDDVQVVRHENEALIQETSQQQHSLHSTTDQVSIVRSEVGDAQNSKSNEDPSFLDTDQALELEPEESISVDEYSMSSVVPSTSVMESPVLKPIKGTRFMYRA